MVVCYNSASKSGESIYVYYRARKNILKIILLSLLCVLYGSAGITIKHAWDRVQRLHHGLKATKHDIHRMRLKSDSIDGLGLPTLSLTANYTHLNEPVGLDISDLSGTLNSLSLPIKIPSEIDFLDDDIVTIDLHVLWPLYTGGKIKAAKSATAAKVAEAIAQSKMEQDKVFLKLVKYYYGVVMMQSLYQTRLESERALRLHYTHARKMKKQGQITQIELLNAKVKLDAARIERKKAKHQWEIVRSAFHMFIQQKKRPSSSLFISRIAGTQERYIRKSMKQYAGLSVLDAKADQAAALVEIEDAAWSPQVLGYGNLNLYNGDSPMEEMTPSWMLGVALKFDIVTGKDRAKEVEAARLLQAKVAEIKSQSQKDLRLAIEKVYREMMLYREEFAALSSSLALASENYRLRSIAFKEGLSTSTEVVDAQMFLSGAKTQRLNAAYNYIKKLSELSVLSGEKALFFKVERKSKKVK